MEDVLHQARRLAAVLSPGDLDHTLRGITEAAVEVLDDVELASITVRHADGRLETAAPTDPLLLDLERRQYELQEGPCYETATDTGYVVSPHLAVDPRWPAWAAVASAHGLQAQAGIMLFESDRSRAALDLYSTRPGRFADLGPLTELFAHHAAVALAYAQEVSDLQQAISTRQRIGQAVGIVMERFELTEQRAFAFLSRLSQQRNVKLRTLADEVIASSPAERP